jgi:hypothetical protein
MLNRCVVETLGGNWGEMRGFGGFEVAFPKYYLCAFRKWRSKMMVERARYRLVETPEGEVWK